MKVERRFLIRSVHNRKLARFRLGVNSCDIETAPRAVSQAWLPQVDDSGVPKIDDSGIVPSRRRFPPDSLPASLVLSSSAEQAAGIRAGAHHADIVASNVDKAA